MTALVALLLAGTTNALAAKPGGTTACPISPATDFAVYGQREYELPKAATKLRFGCMAGAVSEKREVDDVSLFGY